MIIPHRYSFLAVLLIVLTLLLSSKGDISAQSADETAEIYNWMSSSNSNVGDIIFNYLNCDSDNDGVRDNMDARCDSSEELISDQYQVRVNFSSDPTRQNLTGYAWNSKLGKISFNPAELTGCPSGLCRAYINEETGTLNGWAKVVSAIDWKFPVIGPTYSDTTNGVGDYQHQGLAVNGNYLYLGGAKKTAPYSAFLSIFDVSKAENPVMISHTDLLIGGTPCDSGCDSIDVQYEEWNGMKLVFISQYKYGYFIYEVSDPSNPVLMGYKYFSDSSTEAWGTAIYDDHVYVAGTFYLDAGNSADATAITSLLPDCTYSDKNRPGIAYVDLNQLTANPTSEMVFTYLPRSCGTAMVNDLVIYDSYLITGEKNSYGMRVFDLTNPSNPTLVQTYTGTDFSSDAWPYSLYIYDNDLYIAKLKLGGTGTNELMIVPIVAGPNILDTANIDRITVASDSGNPTSKARGVFVNTSNGVKYAYVGSDVGGVNIYDVTDSSSIDKITQFVSTYNQSPYNGQSFGVAYTNGALFSGIDLGSGSLRAFSILKANTDDQWINLSSSSGGVTPSITFSQNSNELIGEADGGDIMGALVSENDADPGEEEALFVSKKPVVTMNISPNPEDSGYTRNINWSVTENAVRCYTAGGNSSWTNVWDFDVSVPSYSGSVTIGPVNEISPDNEIRLICENKFGKLGEESKVVSVNGLDPSLAPKCGSASGKGYVLEPRSNLCSPGTESSVVLEGNLWKWTCAVAGYETKSCSATKNRISIIDF